MLACFACFLLWPVCDFEGRISEQFSWSRYQIIEPAELEQCNQTAATLLGSVKKQLGLLFAPRLPWSGRSLSVWSGQPELGCGAAARMVHHPAKRRCRVHRPATCWPSKTVLGASRCAPRQRRLLLWCLPVFVLRCTCSRLSKRLRTPALSTFSTGTGQR